MSERQLLLRADGNQKVGTGHVMRCLALAQEWNNNDTEFVSETLTENLKPRVERYGSHRHLSTNGSKINDAREFSAIIEQYDDPIVVLDGYDFGGEYQRIISETESTLLVVDDFGHAEEYFADYILDQGLYADKSLYQNVAGDTKFLFGPDYILLRNEFQEWIEYEPTIPPRATNVLLTFGGTDPDNITSLCLDAINKIDANFSITVVLGPANQHYDSVEAVAKSSSHDVTILRNIENMSEKMAWADLAVAAAGTTIWELAFIGVPSILIDIASNQRSSTILDEMNVAIRLGSTSSVSTRDIETGVQTLYKDSVQRERMSQNGQKLVDGLGPKRVLSEITD